ncbi:DUF5682 family protein [Streptomyces coffeae]|uniref:Uncharacterized protein n=1 Tax=Streptomyces coffeae TaxID=621382 RepID=A0ABS1N5X3_9ACTN|nr:DUF5682 family protein [Streptomyces coffeae]MBL1095448.1 hypothetical protein [Streptomyces coffeae]
MTASGAGGDAVWPLLLGVRHHGPGSARAVRAALDAYEPGAVLIEGPPEADAIVRLAADEGMRPPVALLAHAADDPGRAGFWPLAGFSPEWAAIQWALARDVPVRFIDLPAANTLAMAAEERPVPEADAGPDEPSEGAGQAARVRLDPLAALAGAAGYDDPERWWEDVVEHRGPGPGPGPTASAAPFAAVGEAMAALRAEHGDGGHEDDAAREAHMRLRLRDARREFGAEVAVVCGAWHVPALARRSTVTADRTLLRGLPKVKAEISWVPWTHRRLARHSGYGAGIASPGWYSHLFHAPDRPLERWLTKVARLFRDEDVAVSSAHVIEAVRLAETLAALRGRPLPGLAETMDAVRAVMCEGSEVPLALVRDRLIVGDVLGEVPDSAPAVPLQRDLTRTQRSLRLKPEAQDRELELDLRKENDAARSRLLHRLRLLGVEWGTPAASRGSTGTFRETWRLCWEPELAVRVAEAGVWGTTVLSAATAKAESGAVGATTLAEVTELAERCLLAALPGALPVVMRALADRAALDTDVGHLAQALPSLVRSVRYGDVRATDTAALTEVAAGLAERILVGLPPACVGLDPDGASEMRAHMEAVHRAIGLLTETSRTSAPTVAAGPGPVDAPASASAPAPASAAGGIAAAGPAGEPTSPPASGSGPGEVSEPDAAQGASVPAPAEVRERESLAAEGRAGALGVADRDVGLRGRWAGVLRGVAGRDGGPGVPGVIRGRAARLLLDDGRLAEDEAARLMGLALSSGTAPTEAAAWIEGFLGGEAGGGMLLVHDERLLGLVDRWLTGVPADAFTDVLPLLRRTFSAYDAGVRRTLGELVRRGPSGADESVGGGPRGQAAPAAPGFGPGLDAGRAAAAEPTVRLLLGLGSAPAPTPDDHHALEAAG